MNKLPELPEPFGVCEVVTGQEKAGNQIANIIECQDGYSADQMRAYGLMCIAAVLPQQGGEQTILTDEKIVEIATLIANPDSARWVGEWGFDREDLCNFGRALVASAVLPQVGEATRKIAEYDVNGSWYECHTIDEMQQFYLSRLPAIREAAKACGYAIGLHGSGRRDFDLMAMQWIDDCATPDELAHAIAKAACGIVREGPYQWEKKPQGRIATSFTICWTDHSDAFPKGMLSLGHIDLSIIAPAGLGEAKAVAWHYEFDNGHKSDIYFSMRGDDGPSKFAEKEGFKIRFLAYTDAAPVAQALPVAAEKIQFTAVPERKILSDFPQLDRQSAAMVCIGWNDCRDAVLAAMQGEKA
jgi:hypothetical protein